jgi:DNA-binding IclR family transcriptional regulator
MKRRVKIIGSATEEKRAGVDAVDRALSILSAFGEDREVMPLVEISRRTGLYKSTILRIAASLEANRFLERDADGIFHLGSELFRLGSLYRRGLDVGTYVRPILRQLVDQTRETASFYVRDGSHRLCLYRLNSPRAARHHLEEGARLPLDRGAAGRVLRAFSSPADAEGADIRADGYAVSRGERDPDLAAVAVPVFDSTGRLRGALSVSTLISRFDVELEQTILDSLRPAADDLSVSLPASG